MSRSSTAGRASAIRGRGRGTRSQLIVRLAALVALTAAAAGALFTAYHLTHRNSSVLRDRTAAAMVEVATAHQSLGRSYGAAVQSLHHFVPVVGAGSEYRTQVTIATQSLTEAAEVNVAGEDGSRELKTITGQVSTYMDFVEQAARGDNPEPLRAAYQAYADRLLHGPKAGILARLGSLQHAQEEALERQVSLGRWVITAWAAALLVSLALLGALVEAQLFLWRRFRRRANACLLAATLILLAGWGGAAWSTVTAHTKLTEAREELKETSLKDPVSAPEFTKIAARVGRTMAGTEARATSIDFVPIGGVAVAALVSVSFYYRIREYRYQPR